MARRWEGATARSEFTAEALLDGLKREYPDATCALTHQNPFQLLVATILSAQCTDARVNQVTPVLFAAYPDPAAMSRAGQEELEAIIRSTGFYRNKAKSIRAASARLMEAYGGVVPRTMEELLTLPGVARKTANVVLGVGYGIAEGVVVDTHVERLSRRLGLSRGKDPVAIEQELMRALPREEWIGFSHLLIFHGRLTCRARKPACERCVVSALCPSGPIFLAGKVPPAEAKRAARKPGAGRTPVVAKRKKPPARRRAARGRAPASTTRKGKKK
jgi:endonuclease-3